MDIVRDFLTTQLRSRPEQQQLALESGLTSPHFGPKLASSRNGYEDYIFELFGGGMVELVEEDEDGNVIEVHSPDGLEQEDPLVEEIFVEDVSEH